MLQAVFTDLQLCQERLNHLETVCNFLVSSCQEAASNPLGSQLNMDQSSSCQPVVPSEYEQSPEFGKQLETLANHLDKLRQRFAEIPEAREICNCHQNEREERLRAATKTRRRQKAHRTVEEAKDRGLRIRYVP